MRFETEYLHSLVKIMKSGEDRSDRTGVGTRSIFDMGIKVDVSEAELPILTTKRIFFKGILYELLWFLRGDTNIKYLTNRGVNFWNEWADENGDLGPIYGKSLRSWKNEFTGEYVDQVEELIHNLKVNPTSRRHVITTWNAGLIEYMNLPPCHGLVINLYSHNDGTLDMTMYQRSCDMFLGVPFNITSYSLLLIFFSKLTGHKPGVLNWKGGDCHIYHNHFAQVNKQLARSIKNLPKLQIDKNLNTLEDVLSLEYKKDIKLVGYNPSGPIKAEVAV